LLSSHPAGIYFVCPESVKCEEGTGALQPNISMKTVGKTTKEDSGKDCHAINKKDIIRWERTRMKEFVGLLVSLSTFIQKEDSGKDYKRRQ